jgi:predicted phage terminase large subunit-like protein
LDFTTYTYSQYQPEAAHELIAETLDRVVAGDLTRVMIWAPPQHGKSELASVRLPAYWLGRRPDDPVILCSYAASLAYSKSREARSLVESPTFKRLFPDVCTDRSSRAVDHWSLAGRRGALLAAGVGGPVTGHGAQIGIIDDPFENWKQAQSSTIRESVWNWYRATFRTRIWEGGAIVLIMTRWHEDDLAGRLIQQQGDDWTVIRLPALAETAEVRDEQHERIGLPKVDDDPLGREPGEPLCPERFSKAALEEIRRDVGVMVWGAEYQASPTRPGGNRFKRDWLPIVDAAPVEAKRVRYWDKAGTEGDGDYTAGVLMAQSDGIYYVEDVKRGQWSSGSREKVIRQTAQLDRQGHGRVTIWVEQEPGSSGKESAEATVRNLAGFDVHVERPTGDKAVRADPFAAQCEAGNVRLVRGAWNGDYIEELTGFPNAAHDDQVDASSGAFNRLAEPQSAGEYLEWMKKQRKRAKDGG